jgi:DNA-binding GntR family transcriptional regulator
MYCIPHDTGNARRETLLERPNRFVLKSLRERVYEYLKEEMNAGRLAQGAFLNVNDISQQLGISKTPLRDALFQLEAEGFVTIFPRKGAMVNVLTLEKIRNIYQIMGSLESAAILEVGSNLTKKDFDYMDSLYKGMREALDEDDFDLFHERNVAFHGVCVGLSENADLRKMVGILRERLYDFPRNKGFIKEWEIASADEHSMVAKLLREEDVKGAAEYARDVHWNFTVQEPYIRRYYFASQEELDQKKRREDML